MEGAHQQGAKLSATDFSLGTVLWYTRCLNGTAGRRQLLQVVWLLLGAEPSGLDMQEAVSRAAAQGNLGLCSTWRSTWSSSWGIPRTGSGCWDSYKAAAARHW